MESPCLDCEERKLYCHSVCKNYISYKNNHKTCDKGENQYLDYLQSAIRRMKGGKWA